MSTVAYSENTDRFMDALEAINAVKANIENERVWVIQRLVGWKPNKKSLGGSEAIYETVSDYRPMSYDEVYDALNEAAKRYPGEEFRGHKLRPGSRG